MKNIFPSLFLCFRPPNHSISRLFAALLLVISLTACDKALYSALTEQEANEVVAVLQTQGLKANKNKETEVAWSVNVPEADFAASMEVLNAYGLPSRSLDGLGKVFKKETLVSTPTEERARLTYAIAQELQRSIGQMEGVIIARVHPVLPLTETLSGKTQKASASVMIKHRATVDLTPRLGQIRLLVANGIDGLEYDNVSIITVAAPSRLTPALAANAASNDAFGFWRMVGIAVFLIITIIAALTWRFKDKLFARKPVELEAEAF